MGSGVEWTANDEEKMAVVGGIILYTYVFHMLAPPPKGTLDIEDGNLPIKSPPKEDGAAEQVPLLIQEEAASTKSNASEKGKFKDIFVLLYEKLKLKQILQPPIIASILVSTTSLDLVVLKIIGTFDIENGNLPIKSPPKEDGAAEQVPLLTQEEAASTKSNASEKGKVR
ncbi:protein PIN-LIKES 6 [Fagus crenata]